MIDVNECLAERNLMQSKFDLLFKKKNRSLLDYQLMYHYLATVVTIDNLYKYLKKNGRIIYV